MKKILSGFCASLILAFVFNPLAHPQAAETFTLTTYYPSPIGIYNQLATNSLGVGDNSGGGGLTSTDAPTNPGEVWIAGDVGIGTKPPNADLEVNNTLRLTPVTSANHDVKGGLYYNDTNDALMVNSDGTAGGWQPVGESFTQVIQKDPTWVYAVHNWIGPNWIGWHSRGNGEAATGTIKIGYFTLRGILYISTAGSGNSITYKVKDSSDDTTLHTFNNGTNTDTLVMRTIDTSINSGTRAYLEVVDSDNEGGWAWGGFSPAIFTH